MQSIPKRTMTSPKRPRGQVRLTTRQRTARFLGDLLAFSVGVGTSFTVHVIGDIYLAEMLMVLAWVPLLILRGRRLLKRELKTVYVLMGLWLFGLIISDAYQNTLLVNRARGVALILFFALDLACLSM